MQLARVIGTVVATRKDPRLEGFKLLAVRLQSAAGKDEAGYVLAVDTVGAMPPMASFPPGGYWAGAGAPTEVDPKGRLMSRSDTRVVSSLAGQEPASVTWS